MGSRHRGARALALPLCTHPRPRPPLSFGLRQVTQQFREPEPGGTENPEEGQALLFLCGTCVSAHAHGVRQKVLTLCWSPSGHLAFSPRGPFLGASCIVMWQPAPARTSHPRGRAGWELSCRTRTSKSHVFTSTTFPVLEIARSVQPYSRGGQLISTSWGEGYQRVGGHSMKPPPQWKCDPHSDL